MFSAWPIRSKLTVGITLFLVIVVMLSAGGFRGVYAYRGLVKSLRARADELPLATTLMQQVSDLRATAAAAQAERWSADLPAAATGPGLINEQFKARLESAEQTLYEYRAQLLADEADDRIGDIRQEEDIARQMRLAFDRVAELTKGGGWGIDEVRHESVAAELGQLQTLAGELPSHLHRRLGVLSSEVRIQYRSLIALLWITTLSAAALVALFIQLFYRWVFRPLGALVKGSRRVAAGDFSYRIQLAGRDEMAELAEAMNDMTARFQAVRDDLDRQVQLRTKQVVRSEQLASVGFLAAGVAHEINNPLASIAMCAESLEGRLAVLSTGANRPVEAERCTEAHATTEADGNCQGPFDLEELQVIQHYLRMIQSEAFRCKGITEKLLDFSRIGEVKRQNADLRELVAGVIEMVRHLGKYHDRQIAFPAQHDPATPDGAVNPRGNGSGGHVERSISAGAFDYADGSDPIIANINVQELKQVVLNLITNALDSLDPGGTLWIDLRRSEDRAEILFTDDGCGMTDEVLAHLFEPFFTRKRGGQGTGLGLSIVYRIVSDHGGQIDAESGGPGRGSRFRVTLPLAQESKESHHRYQAA